MGQVGIYVGGNSQSTINSHQKLKMISSQKCSFCEDLLVSVSVSVFGIIQYNNYMGNNDKNITVTQESYGHPSLLVQESAMR